MIKLLFVVTTNSNIGDLAFCLEWVTELKRENYRHAFIVDRSIQKFIHKEDSLFFFEHDLHVKETILKAVSEFKADVIIFASNSYWNIAGQKGAERGKWYEEILNLDIPILSFDPLEGLTELYVHLWDVRIDFPPVPENIWSIRASPNIPEAPKTRHFRILNRFEQMPESRKCDILKSIHLDLNKKTVFFPIARNCYYDCRKMFYDYYSHIAVLLKSCGNKAVQFLVLAPEEIEEFKSCKNVIQIGNQPYERFIEILKASDIYLTDCGIASTFLHAMSSSIPSIVLSNSYDSLDDIPLNRNTITKYTQYKKSGKRSFIFNGLYPFKIFPYGMVELFNHDEKLYHFKGCYRNVEVLEEKAFSHAIESLLFDKSTRQSLMDKCSELKSLFMKSQSPTSIIKEVLSYQD